MQIARNGATRAAHQTSSPELAAVRPAKEAAARLRRRGARFTIYDFLGAVYCVYSDWKRHKRATRCARILAGELGIVRRKGTSPIRVLIDATLPSADFKQKSRWVRALEYVHSENVSPSRFRKFVRARGGISRCARLAVNVSRKRRRDSGEGDWGD